MRGATEQVRLFVTTGEGRRTELGDFSALLARYADAWVAARER